MNQDTSEIVDLFVDACVTGCGDMCQPEAYHAMFSTWVLAAHLQYVSWKLTMQL